MNQAVERPRTAVLGAEPVREGVRFGLWSTAACRAEVVIEQPMRARFRLDAVGDGYFAATVADARPGWRYRYRLDGGEPLPDPCSRFQPDGPHGASLVVDPRSFVWSDGAWRGVGMKAQVIYEMHIGTFTPTGTFDAATGELGRLVGLGVTVLEVMPVAEFAGEFGWGYDGVAPYAPFHGYGNEHAFRRFVDAAHAAGLAVILDVVYNHLGADGCYLARFSREYFTDRYENEWGEAVNFDGPHSGPVREYFIRNAAYWIEEFHLDGLRLDATQTIHDRSPAHVLAEVAQAARAAARRRSIIVLAENEPQRTECLDAPEDGGYGLDAIWNDDFHHSMRVALTGRRDGYFHDHAGTAQELLSAVRHGFLFQGQYYDWQRQPRGTPTLGYPAWSMVAFLQNHDQVANTLDGRRLRTLAAPARLRAAVAVLLLGPHTPMLFMGEEYGATQPFPFFADQRENLRSCIVEGRREFLRQFCHYATADAQAAVPDPCDRATFCAAKLDTGADAARGETWALYADLLRLRRTDPVIAAQARESLDGAVLGAHAFVLRYFDARHGDRLLAVNLGADLLLSSAPEPLLAPPREAHWALAWSSEAPRYGGLGALNPCGSAGWRLPADCATLLRAEAAA